MATFADIQEEIDNMLEVSDGELNDDEKILMDQYLDELARRESDKVDSFGRFLVMENARKEALKAESDRLKKKAISAEKRIDYLKNRYASIMIGHGLKKVSGNVYNLSLRKSERVIAPDTPKGLDALPKIYRRVKTIVEPDKTTIKEALKGGLEVPGCKLQENFSLQVR